MDSFSYHSKFKLCKMKVVICISAKLAIEARVTLGVKDFKHKNYCMSCKQKRKKDLILNIPYQSILFYGRF